MKSNLRLWRHKLNFSFLQSTKNNLITGFGSQRKVGTERSRFHEQEVVHALSGASRISRLSPRGTQVQICPAGTCRRRAASANSTAAADSGAINFHPHASPLAARGEIVSFARMGHLKITSAGG